MKPLQKPQRNRRRLSLFVGSLFACLATSAFGQGALLQGGTWTQGHMPMYVGSGTSQAVVQDSGPAGGGAVGLGISELLQVSRAANGVTTAPYANSGTGQYFAHNCSYDAAITNPTGFHYFCFDANASGGGLIAYGSGGGASALPFSFIVNGTTYAFPFVTSGIVGPGTTVVNNVALWNNTAGTLLSDSGIAASALATLTGSQTLSSKTISGSLGVAGSSPALTSCGTSPSITGSDFAGTVTMGTGSPTGCVITFASAKGSAPHCAVTWRATPLASQSYSISTVAITLTQTATSSNVVDYICAGL